MEMEKKRLLVAVAIIVGTCIGAGVLGLPYVAAQSGFILTSAYITGLGLVILLINLYLGEIALRTKEDHQIAGYVDKYLGRKGMYVMEFATVFGIYSALIAYMLGMGESFSYLFFGDGKYTTFFGVGVGILMSSLIKDGIKGLRKFEKIGVLVILLLLVFIFFYFIGDVKIENLSGFNLSLLFLPFGVVLFALSSFHAVPEARLVLHKNEKLFRKSLIVGSIISIIFYILFSFVVLGSQGQNTPQVATLTLGGAFILLGIFTMFTSYIAMGNALFENFIYDERFKINESWVLSSIVPIGLFVLIMVFDIFSFTKILSLGGTISGGLTAILILLMVKSAKKNGERKPEFSIPINWFVIGILSLIFVTGVVLVVAEI